MHNFSTYTKCIEEVEFEEEWRRELAIQIFESSTAAMLTVNVKGKDEVRDNNKWKSAHKLKNNWPAKEGASKKMAHRAK